MIEINLLPEELKKKKRAVSKIDTSSINIEQLPLMGIVLTVAGVIAVIQIILFGLGIVGKTTLNSLEKNHKSMMPKKQEVEQLKTNIATMEKKVSAIDELMVKRFSWARKLNDLSDSVTPGIWLTQLDYDEKIVERPKTIPASIAKRKQGPEIKAATEKVIEKYLVISGAASSMGEEGTALIGRFIQSLKDNASFYSDFDDIELGSIKREQMSGQEVMTFKITCLFKVK